MKYINIHTHHLQKPNEQAIQNLYKNFEQVHQPGKYSIGLHPWYISENWQNDFSIVEKYAVFDNVLAIGECGLDKICTTDVELQQQVFQAQIQLANRCNKPLVIHCVKAFDEVLQLLKQATVPVVFHGFVKSKALALQIIKAGYYLSFGKALQQPRMQEVLSELPMDRIFLETDDAPVSIAEIYSLAANAFSIEEDLLSLQLEKNALNVFKLKV